MLSKPDLSKPFFRIFQPKLRQLILNGYCPDCKIKITKDMFRDEISRKEYSISGLCQFCQDKVFGSDSKY